MRRLVCRLPYLGMVGWLSSPLMASPQQGTVNPAKYGIRMHGYTSSVQCKLCHTAIHEIWSRSMHANATRDPVFTPAYEAAVERGGQEAKRLCLSCHSPTTAHTRDYDLTLPLSNEGITCDFCHTVSKVDLSSSNPFTHDLGPTKRGLHRDMTSPAHFTKYSPVHSKSEFCGGCHDFRSPEGVPILETYSEWVNSPYAKRGIQCQNCHMRRQPGKPLVNRDVKVTNALAPDHVMSGGHSEVRLQDAAKVSITARDRGKHIEVVARVANVGAGHKLPTGAPTRRVILEVSLRSASGDSLGTQRRVYQKTLVDDRGRPLTTVEDSFVRSERVESDTRLAPEEVRVERFTFGMPKARDSVIVDALLTYKFETPPGTMYVKMAEATRLLLLTSAFWGSGGEVVFRNALLFGLAAGIVCFVWMLCLRRKQPKTFE